MIKNIYRSLAPVYLKVRVNSIRGQQYFHPYNDELKCIFVHIPKTAGTSLQKTLFDFTHTGHIRWDEYRAIDKKRYDLYFKFAFVRNPWDRLVSAYFYLKAGGRNSSDKEWSERVLSKYDSFESFVLGWLTAENIKTWNHFVPQTDFIYDKNDKLMIDFLGKFENLVNDFNFISDRIGVNRELENINKSERGDYREYYNDKTKEKVRMVYERDISLLGYDF